MKNFSPDFLERKRAVMDAQADEVLSSYQGNYGLLQGHISTLRNNAASVSEEMSSELIDLWSSLQDQRADLDLEVLQKGFKFFDQHASDVMLLLGLLSLPYCYAAAKGSEVLVRSKYILENPEKRLLETAEFVFEVLKKNAFSEYGAGLVQILKVRLMHAMVRFRIEQSGSWDEQTLGKPINQEDMAGTNLSFSLIVVRGLRELGKDISAEDAENYINYWNQIGTLLGVNEDLQPETAKEAYVLDKSIRNRHFEPSEAGKKLFASLRNYFVKATVGSPIEGITDAFMEKLLGKNIAKMLGLEITNLDRFSLLPYTSFLSIKNNLGNQSDSYLNAFEQFSHQRKQLAK